jgi:uncharacterized short protein YbdD (DUF466 family)
MTEALRNLCRSGWRFVREVTGDDAYERYLAHHRQAHSDEPPMSQDEYFRFRLAQKWSRVSRCC